MLKNLTRKKQPEQVRRSILQAATDIAAEQGLEFVTTTEVARRAGVTSGGLFHHFPSKKHLIEELIAHFIKDFEALIEEQLMEDPDIRGRFTRAYLIASYKYNHRHNDNRLLGAIVTAMNRNDELAEAWADWLDRQMKKYGQEKDPVLASIIRYAADGLWLEVYAGPERNLEKQRAALERLLEWTTRL